MDERHRPRSARHVAGGDEPVVRHLGARAVLDAGARLHVVVHPPRAVAHRPRTPCRPHRRRARRLQPLLLRRGDGRVATEYRLLLDGARFADAHGFAAVWTPERHFHAFGGLYPNPAVTGAAVAAVTSRVSIRAGSVVLPLHSSGPRRRGVGGRRQHLRRAGRRSRSRRAGSRTTSCCSPTAYADREGRHAPATSRSCGGCGAARRSTFPATTARRSTCARCRAPCSPSCRSG